MKPCILEGLKHLCCPLHLAAQTQVPVCAGDANGDAETARGMAESKLSAFGLPIPQGMFMRQRSGGPPQARGGPPPSCTHLARAAQQRHIVLALPQHCPGCLQHARRALHFWL